MKAFYFCLLLSIAGIFGCRQVSKPAAIVTSADYKKGVSFLDQQPDSAYYYFNKTATSSKDSLQIALAYNNMAVIQSDAGDYFGSQESLLSSLKYLDENNESDTNCLIADFNELGRNSSKLQNYATAISYYDRALKLIRNDYSKTITLNNKAIVYRDERQYSQAISIYLSIINQSRKEKREYARILSNLAKVRWLKDSSYKAAPELMEALQIRKSENDNWGLNASYSHLSDYYSHSHPDSALLYARQMYAIAQQLNSPDDKLEALQKLISLSSPAPTKNYFSEYQYLSDSLQTARNAAKNQFALIRYEAQKNKADIFRLEKDNSEKNIQIIKQWAIIAGTLILLIMAFVYNKNRIRQNRLRTSQKVHDVVANGLYHIMAKIEHQPNLEKEELLDDLEILYDQSRDISYEKAEKKNPDFHIATTALLGSFANANTKIFVVGSDKVPWDTIKSQTKKEIETILLELMVNMKKHSGAGNVVVRLEMVKEALIISYQDDGVGLPPTLQYGNGLTNTENRIKKMDGQITFDNSLEKGFKLKIVLPNA